jgi:3D (Asp-Asp-Asp) domain-containing protein
MKKNIIVAWMLILCILTTSMPLQAEAAKKNKNSKKIMSLLDSDESIKGIGEFEATFYCTKHCCNGSWSTTALGTALKPNKTIAVDKNVIKLGSEVIIKYPNGKIARYRAEDTGSAIRGRRIDVCVASHTEANRLGRQKIKVYVVQ